MSQVTRSSTSELLPMLQAIPTLSGLSDEVLLWLIERSEEHRYDAGEKMFEEGDPAEQMTIMLEGEFQARSEKERLNEPIYIATRGMITGMLPYSRMTHYARSSRAVLPVRMLTIHVQHFPEMIARFPQLIQRLVGVMSDRVREVTKQDHQHDKLLALGKLSAGLAHELNNPAAAAHRAAEQLREQMHTLSQLALRVNLLGLTDEQRNCLFEMKTEAAEALVNAPKLDALTASEREDEITDWLDNHGINDGWKYAATLVQADTHVKELDELADYFSGQSLEAVVQWFAASLSADELINEIEQSSGRISELVRAIKEYSYMDQAPLQEIDVHRGLESTLTILNHKLRKGVTVTRYFSEDLPRIYAYGSELNQVWTNLIDNAIDAMGGKGNLWIRTTDKTDHVLVEINDNGPGISLEVKDRIFEPFFTTKGVGEGTGLGLDTVYRTVTKHHGDIRFTSEPGNTCFQVRLPIHQPTMT